MKVLLAQKLREFRKKQGLTQEQLAEAMGVTVGAVSKWESGASTPDVSLILELADFSKPAWTCSWATPSRAPA